MKKTIFTFVVAACLLASSFFSVYAQTNGGGTSSSGPVTVTSSNSWGSVCAGTLSRVLSVTLNNTTSTTNYRLISVQCTNYGINTPYPLTEKLVDQSGNTFDLKTVYQSQMDKLVATGVNYIINPNTYKTFMIDVQTPSSINVSLHPTVAIQVSSIIVQNMTNNKYDTLQQIAMAWNVKVYDCTLSYAQPNFGITASSLCSGGIIGLSDSSINAVSWQWTVNDQNNGNVFTSSVQNPTAFQVWSAGMYNVTLAVQDIQGRTSMAFKSFTIFGNPPMPTITQSAGMICAGDSATLSTNIPGTYSYTWSNNGNIVANSNSDSIVVKNSGSYALKITDQHGCLSQSQWLYVNVYANPKLWSIATTTNLISQDTLSTCFNKTIDLSVGYYPGWYSYINYGNYAFSWSDGIAGQNHPGTKPGTYVLTITDMAGYCSSHADTIVITNYPHTKPTITSSGVLSFCSGNSVTLYAHGGTNYHWHNPSTFIIGDTLVVRTTDNYFISYIDSYGCIDSSQSVVTTEVPIPTKPSITTSGCQAACNETGGHYRWFVNNIQTQDSTQFIHTDSIGWYTCQVANGDCWSDVSVPIYINCRATGIADVSDIAHISVYPNPFASEVSVALPNNVCTITIYDALGQQVYRKESNHSVSIDTEHFVSGRYILMVQNTDGAYIARENLVCTK